MGGRGSPTGVAALAALALLAPGASARAGTVVVHVHVIAGSAASVLYTDGSAWAAYEPHEGVTRVIGPHRRITREDPRDCLLGAGPRAVHLVAAGAAKLLYQCEGPAIEADDLRSYQYVVVDAATGAEHLVAAPVEPPSRHFLSH